MYISDLQTAYCRDLRRVHMGSAPSLAMVGQAFGRGLVELFEQGACFHTGCA